MSTLTASFVRASTVLSNQWRPTKKESRLSGKIVMNKLAGSCADFGSGQELTYANPSQSWSGRLACCDDRLGTRIHHRWSQSPLGSIDNGPGRGFADPRRG